MAFDSKARSVVIGVTVLAVAVSIAGLYYVLGARSGALPTASSPMPSPAPMMATPSPAAPASTPAPGAQGVKGVPTMVQAAEKLSKRLEAKDGSADDWTLLARTYVELRQYPEAIRAFQHALEKSPGDAALQKEADAARKAAGEAPPPR